MDQELRFKEQAAHALAKGTKWVAQFRRMAKIAKGMKGEFMRAVLYGVALPSMLYAADVWCVPPVRRANGRQTRGTRGFIGRMERVQRQAVLQITGALRTTSTDLLLAHADIAPIESHIRKVCYSAALRIATLPQTNPIGKAARRAARHHVKRLPSPLHNIMAMLQVHPDEIEKIQPVRKHPHWKSAIETVIPENKDQAETRELNNEADIRVYSDGSGYEGGVGAAAVLYRGFRPMKTLHYYLGTLDEHTVYEGECVAMMLGLELIRRETGWVLEATMGVDNQAVITATGMGKPAPGSYIVDKIHASYQRVTERHSRLRFTLGWVPGHKGIPGNERADEEAKRAAGGAHNNTSNRIPFLTKGLLKSKAALCQAYRGHIKQQVASKFKDSPRYRRATRINSTMPSTRFRRMTAKLSQRHTSLLIQLRTCHIPLKHYLY